jgi:endonuclease YncB( thermonuclease family)
MIFLEPRALRAGVARVDRTARFIAIASAATAFASVIALLCFGLPTHAASTSRAGPSKSIELVGGRVTHVADGDTVTLAVGSRDIRVRLNAIDAPELAQTYGTRAKAALERLCEGKQATLKIEKTDRAGRSVGELTCAGRNTNEAMVAGGHAWVFDRFVDAQSPLYELQKQARAGKRGLWADANPTPPWQWRDKAREDKPWLAELYDKWQKWWSE